MGISQAIVGAGGIVYPILIEFMMEEYGFRGRIVRKSHVCLLIVTAIRAAPTIYLERLGRVDLVEMSTDCRHSADHRGVEPQLHSSHGADEATRHLEG